MGLTSSLFAGLSGMKTNEFRMDVIGNNIANVNTHGYKSQRATFQNQFSQTFTFGSAPSGTLGGTNPMQVGTGSAVGAMSRDFSMGSPEATGIVTDLSVQGQGLFILGNQDGSRVYTRTGNFTKNEENYLISASGYYLQGYGVDKNFNIGDKLDRLKIPISEITTAAVTNSIELSGNLNADANVKAAADIAASGAINSVARQVMESQVLYSDNTQTNAALATTALTTLYDGSGNLLFETGNIIKLADASKGGVNLKEAEFVVGTTGTNLGELADWMRGVLGINNDTANLLDFSAYGISDSGSSVNAGMIELVGNVGAGNNILLGSKGFAVEQGTAATAPVVSTPFQFSSNTDGFSEEELKHSLGESKSATITSFDSLGNPIDVRVTMVKETSSNAGITWRFFAESGDDTETDRTLGMGTLLFNTEGNLLSQNDTTVTVNRDGTGATTPQSIILKFSEMNGFNKGGVITVTQDGTQAGTLKDYSISPDGTIWGAFDNGMTKKLGQVALATFRNYEGLVAEAGNLFREGPNSGDPVERKPLELGVGGIQSASLELSNVDLSREFINLIISSTGFSASSRVIQTSDQLLNELIALVR